MFELIGVLLAVALAIVAAVFFMCGTEILYSVSAAVIPLLALLMVAAGCMVGLFTAVKNTLSVYWKIFFQRGR